MYEDFDWFNPSYAPILADRAKRLKAFEKSPLAVKGAKLHYASHPWDFVMHWGVTFDPRELAKGRIAVLPFIMWPRQVEFLKWIYSQYTVGERGLIEKCRDGGVTWLSVGFATSMFLFVDGFTCGFGSRKEELVDKRGDDKSIFERLRFQLEWVPDIFMPKAWNPRTCISHMRISNPDTKAAIVGEAGDEIGRGGRSSIYLVDEAAFIERQEKVNRALSQNTNCQIDISTYNGSGNEFYKNSMRFDNTSRKFVFDWRDDPRKDDVWYQKQVDEQDEVAVAQEIDRDPHASTENIFIPSKYVKASIDAHLMLGFTGVGMRCTGFDVADVGDAKAIIHRHGSIITGGAQKKQGTIVQAIPWAFDEADERRSDALAYDADGMGAPSMKLYLDNVKVNRMKVLSYNGSAGVRDKEMPKKLVKRARQEYRGGQSALQVDEVKTNADTFVNFRAQSWWEARVLFENTYNAIEAIKKGHIHDFKTHDLISIDSSGFKPDDLIQLQAELSRPTRIYTGGLIRVESKAEMKKRNVDSPNLADALVIAVNVSPEDYEKDERDMTTQYESYQQTMDGVM